MAAISRVSNFKRFLSRNPVIRYNFRTCYYLLLPEIPPDTPESDALLKTEELVNFKSVTATGCFNALAKLSLQHEAGIWNIEKEIKEKEYVVPFEAVIDPLEKLGAPLDAVIGVAKTLYVTNSKVMPQNSFKTIHEKARKSRSLKFTSRPIYEACKNLLNAEQKPNDIKRRLLSKFVLEGKLNGAELTEADLKNYIASVRRTEGEKVQYQAKVNKAREMFSHTIKEPSTVRDFPSELLRAIAVDSSTPSRGPWKATLQPNVYDAFMEHCPDRAIRWNVWSAARSMCSPGQNKEVSTSLHLEEIRFQRRDQAKILGYPTFADISMETKMAGSVTAVNNMISALLEKAFPAQQKELDALQEFAKSRRFDDKLEQWDVPYWRRKQRAALFKFEEGEVREYFPLPRVLSGLFSLIEDVFSIRIEPADDELEASTWHPDAKLYTVRDHRDQFVGHFYFDPYARTGQKLPSRDSAAWMIGFRSKSQVVGHTPSAAVIMNLTPPLHGIPSLLSFGQVQTLFSKVGHALQHLMTQSPYSEVAGLTNLEWDAVQVSAQFLQCWLTDWTTMTKISGHFESGQPLDRETFNQLNKAAVHMAATDLCQQLYLSALDIELHSTKDFWLDVVKRLWPKYHHFPLEKFDAHPCSFDDIVSGYWPAAYYSHVWSRMVAVDMFSAFQEVGLDDRTAVRKTGERFRDTVLAHGGSCQPGETFRQFRGRDPSPDALLAYFALRRPVVQ